MKQTERITQKIFERNALEKQCEVWRKQGKKIVFTNGCFDILHKGHLEILTKSAEFGDILVVALNTDASVKRLKGDQRPVNNEDFRTLMLASLEIVDAVTLFDEPTPLELIQTITPNILVKGGDYTVDQIVGAQYVLSQGGEVKIVPYVKGYSTTGIIAAIQRL
ncbi:MAG TPA: D-glycero-beta-D-manno-heptose 1-phosphate adenylyltransferase [Chitinophagaceae bacterium]|nr:D-glycero-beta-D-manno-heptose 1-phosphate adenylyltransferase [Chitinophagaceae bacterium]